ncbi:disintegrin and metalloproteinase domain-containing protein 2 isoform X2 [Talpa occidentalis]|uniref:disintegrin and metalloproteinase domain-containing protein 2 isoform X2 n=1 Tax=Talpa occidentalis TaxID=50954 RepID=UPI0023F94037|nr:disintegrin and metalloproteinase domain-containing protein 2 isoform X2 [Talpa occidentalis]
MLCFLLLLTGLVGIQTDYNSERLRVQIMIPKKIRSMTTGGVESHLSYNITIDGKIYTLNLMQKTFLPHNFRVYAYNGSGSKKPFEQQFQNFCHYQGYIEGYPNSMVIISTCTGLRGLLQFENVSYGIEPLEPSIGFEHVIYQIKHKSEGISLYTEEDFEPRDMPYKIQSVETQFSQYIEMHIVVEKNLYNHMGSDTDTVSQKIFQLIGLTNAIFTSFNITIILSSLELWIDANKIPVTGDANELLHRFLKWKRSYLVLRPHDMAFLFVYREKPDYVGATFQGKMCDGQYGGGVALHPKTISLEALAVILAQLLSLSMGIAYDDINKCQCSGTVCIMNPEAIHSSGVKSFSNCSMEDFAHFISKSKSQCLQNHPRLDPSYKSSVCGNGEVEEGEQCDCGSQEFANSKKMCRAILDDCDLPEYCNGTSAVCQTNYYIQNGVSCKNQWLCMNGRCIDGLKQCTDLYGEDAQFGTPECFTFLNSKADVSGHCGSDASGYKKCDPANVMCGKLICIYDKEIILSIKDVTTIYANINNHICITMDYKYDTEDYNNMWVKDGTVCGENKICKNKECVDNEYLSQLCPADKCKGHGVCNNNNNCHCESTYLPPDCEKEDASYPGGSVDSGNFPQTKDQSITDRYIENVYHSRRPRWPYYLLIPFFIVLCLLIAKLVKVYFQRKKWRTEEYTSDEQLESESEPKE